MSFFENLQRVIPAFDWHRVVVAPWTEYFAQSLPVALMAFLAAATCGLVGNYLLLRRMALMGDAISHSVLPGLVLAFLATGSRGTGAMFTGAVLAGVVTTLLIEMIHKKTRVKQDAAMAIAFSTLFAIGVILTTVFASQIDLDADCVLYGDLTLAMMAEPVKWFGVTLGPVALVRMAVVFLVVGGLIVAFYKELLVSSFDEGLAKSLGINPTLMHYTLMVVLSVVVVSAFEAVGAILVIAMLILPGATASLLSSRLPVVHGLAVAHAAASAWLGVTLDAWLDCTVASAMAVAGALIFGVVWLVSPREGLIARWWRRRSAVVETARAD